jgi:hypothetical protein
MKEDLLRQSKYMKKLSGKGQISQWDGAALAAG